MKHIIYISAIILIVLSCRKEDSSVIDGPSLNDLYGPFFIVEDLTLSQSTINFSADGDLIFNAELSKNTDWVIEITGASTGASRTISGTEKVLSLETATWEGGANTFPSFGLEKAYIEVSFPNEIGSPILKDSVVISGSKTDDGILITSFENGEGANWSKFNQAGVAGEITCGDAQSAKDDCYYGFNGTVPWDWAVGSVMVKPDAGTFNLPAQATNLYFNAAVNFLENTGPEECFLEIWFDEDEDGDGEFDEATEDRYVFAYWYQKDGWDLISVNYNELQFDADGNKIEVNGNGLPEPSKLVGVNVFYLANKDSGLNSKALIDHLIFTTDEPYRP